MAVEDRAADALVDLPMQRRRRLPVKRRTRQPGCLTAISHGLLSQADLGTVAAAVAPLDASSKRRHMAAAASNRDGGMMMQARLDVHKAAPAAYQALSALENYVRKSGIDPKLLQLIKVRASQINGCAYCIHMHTHDARARGESEDRLHLLAAWRESPLYSERERAALAWTEALTLISETHAPDEVYEDLRRHYSEEEIVNLSVAVAMINTWNRIVIGFRMVHPVESAHAV
jgi:AhpD family alkylhydroperoxidase